MRLALSDQPRCPDGTWAPKSGDCSDHEGAREEPPQHVDPFLLGEWSYIRSPQHESVLDILADRTAEEELTLEQENYLDAWSQWQRDMVVTGSDRIIGGWTAALYKLIQRAHYDPDEYSDQDHEEDRALINGWPGLTELNWDELDRPTTKALAHKIARKFDKALAMAPLYHGVAFRGLTIGEDDFANWKEGASFRARYPLSWSRHSKVARQFTTGITAGGKETFRRVLLVSDDFEGVDVDPLSFNQGEGEVVAPAGSRYTITGIMEQEDVHGPLTIVYLDADPVRPKRDNLGFPV